ncbi:MAG TPA: sodium:proton antiporter, partial [Candidatus Limnocylindrales bacterium]|nr:sodium:proton antiporter [Candidatus Limnocylindrales bacterium]
DATLVLIRLFAVFVAVSVAVSLIARRTALPHAVVLVACGLGAGLFVRLSEAEIPPELVLLVLIPGLIFEASYKIDSRILRRSLPAVVLLAGPGVFVTGVVVALVLHAADGMPLATGFVVGAIVSATDPAAVIATFRHIGAPRRLSTLVEAESVFNDGTGIVVFSIAAAALVRPISLGDAALQFVAIVLVSGLIGFACGQLGTRLIVRVEERVVELGISLLLAYGTYLIADALHQSGVIATAVAGIVLGNEGRRLGLSSAAVDALDTVWEFLAYLLTALVFLLVGLAIPITTMAGALPAILAAVAGVLVARGLVVYGLLGALRHVRGSDVREEVPVEWLHVIFWSGLRGAIAVALALSLAPDVPGRTQIQEIAFGVVLFTLVVQATTVEALLRRLGVGAVNTMRRGPAAANGQRESRVADSAGD